MAATRLKLTSTAADASATGAAAAALAGGELVVVPLETVYGVMAKASDAVAVAQLRGLRPGSEGKAMTLHVASRLRAEEFIDGPTRFARRLMEKLWPGPVAMVFGVSERRRREVVAREGVAEGDLYDGGEIVIRCPAHKAARAVLEKAGVAVVGAVAGEGVSRATDLPGEVLDKARVILDDGPAAHGKPSTVIRVHEDRFEVVRAGVYDRRIIEKMLQTTILFVCSGNTCRSPMAEAITRKVLAEWLKIPEGELAKEGYTVMSAGASAFAGAPATANSVEAAKLVGAELGNHRSRLLTQGLVHQATVVFGMARSHVEAAKGLSPHSAARIELLDRSGEIEDPIGGDIGLYKKLALRLKTLIEQRLADGSLLGREK